MKYNKWINKIFYITISFIASLLFILIMGNLLGYNLALMTIKLNEIGYFLEKYVFQIITCLILLSWIETTLKIINKNL